MKISSTTQHYRNIFTFVFNMLHTRTSRPPKQYRCLVVFWNKSYWMGLLVFWNISYSQHFSIHSGWHKKILRQNNMSSIKKLSSMKKPHLNYRIAQSLEPVSRSLQNSQRLAIIGIRYILERMTNKSSCIRKSRHA